MEKLRLKLSINKAKIMLILIVIVYSVLALNIAYALPSDEALNLFKNKDIIVIFNNDSELKCKLMGVSETKVIVTKKDGQLSEISKDEIKSIKLDIPPTDNGQSNATTTTSTSPAAATATTTPTVNDPLADLLKNESENESKGNSDWYAVSGQSEIGLNGQVMGVGSNSGATIMAVPYFNQFLTNYFHIGLKAMVMTTTGDNSMSMIYFLGSTGFAIPFGKRFYFDVQPELGISMIKVGDNSLTAFSLGGCGLFKIISSENSLFSFGLSYTYPLEEGAEGQMTFPFGFSVFF